MTELISPNPTHNTRIRTDNNLACDTHAFMHIPTVDNLVYSTRTHASSTQLQIPAPPMLSMDDFTYFFNPAILTLSNTVIKTSPILVVLSINVFQWLFFLGNSSDVTLTFKM